MKQNEMLNMGFRDDIETILKRGAGREADHPVFCHYAESHYGNYEKIPEKGKGY